MVKFILCRPQGGLNDMLGEIERCCLYAEKFQRAVIVDTAFKNSMSFWETFSKYFISKSRALMLDAAPLFPQLEKMSVYPASAKGVLHSYACPWVNGKQSIVGADGTATKLTFDFGKDYAEDLLLHQHYGGSTLAQRLHRRLRLHDSLVDELTIRLLHIGGTFTGVHVRHTDMKSDYQSVIEKLRVNPPQKLFIATDNQQVVADFKKAFGADNIFSFATLPAPTDESLHEKHHEGISRERLNRDAILDLFTLAFATELQIADRLPKAPGAMSGFAKLAKHLNETPEALNAWVARPYLMKQNAAM